MSNNTVLRQAINNVNITGYLKKMELKKGVDNEGQDVISGNMVIETAPHNEITVNVYTKRMTKATPEKPAEETAAYKGLTRIMEEYVSMATLMANGASEEEARTQCTKVSANRANLSLNEYWDHADNMIVTVRAGANFFSRVQGDFSPCSRFDIEGFVTSKKPEVKGTGDNMNETGRLIIEMVVPGYRGVAMPFTFVTAPDVSSYIDDHYNVGDTIRVYGNMVNSVNVISTRKPGIKEEYETTTTYVNELLIDNGMPEPYDSENPSAYSREAITAALNVRNSEYLPTKHRQQREREAKKNNSGAATTGFATNGFAGNAPKANNNPFSWGN